MMRRLLLLPILVCLLAAPAAGQEMTPDEKAVRAAVEDWIVALNAMFAGSPEPFAKLYSHADDVTYMGAEGTYRIGWEATFGDWKKHAAESRGGEVHAAEIHIVVDGNIATAIHYTEGTTETAQGRLVDTRVRESSVFRKENGVWKMIRHQADNYPVWVKVVDR